MAIDEVNESLQSKIKLYQLAIDCYQQIDKRYYQVAGDLIGQETNEQILKEHNDVASKLALIKYALAVRPDLIPNFISFIGKNDLSNFPTERFDELVQKIEENAESKGAGGRED